MENASRALVIAGGIFIAIMIVGAFLLMFNQISAYQKADSSSEKVSQIAEFNQDFARYADENSIQGTDLISLANKIIDYNKRANAGGVTNYVDYNIKMSLEVDLTGFKNKFGYEKSEKCLFTEDKYIISDENGNKNSLKEIIDSYNGQDVNLLKKLSLIYNAGDSKANNINKIKAKLVEIKGEEYKDWNGTNKQPTLEGIKNYKEYSEFKSSSFVPSKDPEYENGQIKKLFFKFKN